MIRTNVLGRAVAAAILLAGAAGLPRPAAADGASLSPTRVMNSLGLTLGEQVAIEEGKVIGRPLERRADTELAAMAVTRVKVPVAAVRLALLGEPGARRSPGTDVRVPVNEADWRGLSFREGELERLRNDVNGGPGDGFNLSAAEIERLRGLSGPALANGYRDVLIARTEAYASRGLAGITGYARREGESKPARELGKALEISKALLQGSFPNVVAALAGPPLAVKGVEQWFSVARPTIDGRSAVVLIHEVVASSDDTFVHVERQFYVSHTYNSLQSLTLAMASGDGTVIARVGRTYTDRVAGPFAGMEREVGQKMIGESLVNGVRTLAAEAVSAAARTPVAGRPAPG